MGAVFTGLARHPALVQVDNPIQAARKNRTTPGAGQKKKIKPVSLKTNFPFDWEFCIYTGKALARNKIQLSNETTS